MKQIWKLDHTFTVGLQDKLKLFAKNALHVDSANKANNASFGNAVMVRNYGNHAQITTCMGLNGLLFSNKALSLLGQHLALGNISFEEYNIDFLSKVLIFDNGRIKNSQRPFIVLCRLFSMMLDRIEAGTLTQEDRFITKTECINYLFPDTDASADQYEPGSEDVLNDILQNRPVSGDNSWNTHDSWDAALSATNLIVCRNDAYYLADDADHNLIKFIADFAYDNVDTSTTLYDHLADEKNGILSRISAIDENALLNISVEEAYKKLFEDQNSAHKIFKNYPGLVISVLKNNMLRDRLFAFVRTLRGESESPEIHTEILQIKEPALNRVYFGAPGTGKSHELNIQAKQFLPTNIERVTFFANYSYAQFVGGYKPVMVPREKTDESGKKIIEKVIEYAYVPGPFIRTLIKAMRSSGEQFLLIVEELNRANAAAVFGDTFQLLDRNTDGISEYPITVTDELNQYLIDEKIFTKDQQATLKIPANMYIWATMNSADQGVFPMDTAFRRRWDYEYIDINNNEADVVNCTIKCPNGTTYSWNMLRKAINDKLSSEHNINEDKLIGPFFIAKELLDGSDKSSKAFNSKVLMYLFEDAARHCRNSFFCGDGQNCKPEDLRTYSAVCKAFDKYGARIFGEQTEQKAVGKTQENGMPNITEPGSNEE